MEAFKFVWFLKKIQYRVRSPAYIQSPKEGKGMALLYFDKLFISSPFPLRSILAKLIPGHQCSLQDPTFPHKRSSTDITKLVLNANIRDRAALESLRQWIFHDRTIGNQSHEILLNLNFAFNPNKAGSFESIYIKWLLFKLTDADAVRLFSH